MKWHTPHKNQGQIVVISWTGIGDRGALRRAFDASDRSVAYTLHPWTDSDGDWDPWDGCPVESGYVESEGTPCTLEGC